MSQMRRGLALARLGLLFILICLLMLLLDLALLRGRQQGWPMQERPQPASSPTDEIPFLGVTIEMDAYADAERRAALERLRSAGFGWVRQRIDWGLVEPEPGQYQWQLIDPLLQEIAQSGLEPVVVLDGSPAWARAAADRGAHAQPLAPPADPADFAAFAQAFATRYAHLVRYYQIWDEPNIAPHWGNRHIEPVEYARLLQAAGEAIRQVDGDAVILLAALAPTIDRGHTAIDEIYFLQRLYAAQLPHDAPRLFDVVAIQPFGFQYTPTDQRLNVLNFQRARLVHRAMVGAGDHTTPVWAVRYGWNRRSASPWSTVAPETQAEFATDALSIASTEWPWLIAMGWAVDRPAVPATEPMWGFALNETLLDGFTAWQPPAPSPLAATQAPGASQGWRWIGILLLGLVVSAWRGWTVGRGLPWRRWIDRLRAAPRSLRVGSWLVLLLVYYLSTWPPLIAICLISAALLTLARPLEGLCLAALVIPFYFQHKEISLLSIQWTLAPVQAATLALLPALIVRRSRGAWRDGWSILAAAWLLLNLLGIGSAWRWGAYMRGVVEMAVVPLLLFTAARRFIQTEQQARQVGTALFVGGGMVAVVGLVRWFGGQGTDADGVLRLVGPHFSPNHTALYLERTLFVGIGFAVAGRSFARGTWLAACGVVLAALLLTASRGAILLGLPIGFLLVWWVQRRAANVQMPRRRRMPVWFWLLVGGVACGSALLAFALFQERLLNSATLVRRLLIWRATWQLWLDHFWLGVGAEGFFWRYPAYVLDTPQLDPNLRHPHNVWLEMTAIWGVGGFVWIVGLLALMARDFHAVRRGAFPPWPYIGLLIGLLVGLAHAQVDAFMALADLASWQWLALGMWSCYTTKLLR